MLLSLSWLKTRIERLPVNYLSDTRTWFSLSLTDARVTSMRPRNYSRKSSFKHCKKISQLRNRECFGSWLRQITVRMAINRMVRGDRAVSTEPVTLEATVMSNETPDDVAIADERAEFVRDGLDRLREMDRDTLIAFYVKGQSIIEMSDSFDAPIGTIKRRLHVARQRLAKEIDHLVMA